MQQEVVFEDEGEDAVDAVVDTGPLDNAEHAVGNVGPEDMSEVLEQIAEDGVDDPWDNDVDAEGKEDPMDVTGAAAARMTATAPTQHCGPRGGVAAAGPCPPRLPPPDHQGLAIGPRGEPKGVAFPSAALPTLLLPSSALPFPWRFFRGLAGATVSLFLGHRPNLFS